MVSDLPAPREQLAVQAEGYARYHLFMCIQWPAKRLTTDHIPQNRGTIPAHRGEQLAIWAEGHFSHIAPQHLQRLPRRLMTGYFPKNYGTILTRRSQQLSVRTKGQAGNY